MKKVLKNVSILAITLLPNVAFAQIGSVKPPTAGLSTKSFAEMVLGIVNVALGFVTVIALAVIIYGGFRWMTAGGNEESVGEAKKILTAGIIGLVVILIAWVLITFASSLVGGAV